ncbi:MAG: CusA/CzcA family heavy metal efflux RND transporter [Flavobacteriales bacterium CG_4_10_14_0_2_um_filter_32_8]|nr:MAG: CusA/CzcA family heavy metal efflux RND transporter [Flavobacteriales bacterium CG_4_10_14_0_2_um_filter_32_8]
MLNKIIAFSIKNKLIIGLFILSLIGYGSYEITKLPIDAVPDITDNQVQVITVSPSLGAADIERLITFPIEQANSNIPGMKKIRSFSRFGLSLITIVFEDDVDIYWARQQVTEQLKLAQEQIPKGLGSPELAPVTTGLGEIYQYVIRAKQGYETKYDETELRTIQDWIVRRQLIGVKGVADVSSFGGKLKQYEIAIDVNQLKSHNITINDVFTALENNNNNTGGAYIEKKSTVLYIRTKGLIGTIDDIKSIVVKNTSNGTPLLIKDVADVRIGSAVRYGGMTYNDEGETAGGVVMMLKGGNSSTVIKNVKDRIIQIERTLPEGVVIEPFLDRTKMVNNAIGTVSKNLMEGALIVIFVLVLFLGNFRAGLLVASVIPLAMLFAIIMMNLFGVSGNLMSLGALDFGLIVDGAVIIVEAVMHSIVHGKKLEGISTINQAQMDNTVNSSASRMMNSAMFGQIIILVVYLPIFTLEGIEGKMFKPMAQTVAFALLGAFILSLTYIPMMSALFLSKTISHKRNFSDRMMDFFIHSHQKYLSKVLNFPKTIIGISISLLLISLFIFSKMGGEFIPELPEGDFALETRVLTGSNINTTADACLKAAYILKKKFPEVEKVIGKVGSGEIPTDPMPMEAADLMIILKDKSEWTSAETWDEMAEKMGEALKDVPGVTFSFQYPVAMRFNELMTGAKQDVVCKIFGENLDTLSKYSKLLGNVANKIEGAQDIYVEPIDGLPQVEINYKRNVIAQYGLTISDINRVVNIAFAGQSSGLVFEDEKRFDLVVRLAGEKRKNLEDIQNLLIPTPNGTQIPLYQVADVSIQESVNQIQREDAKRRIIVGFNIHDRDVQTIVKDLQTQIDKKIKLPSGYYITYGGAFENLVAAKKRLSLAVPLSLLLIFLFLYFAFGSIKQGLLIYSAIPLSTIGGILFLYLRGLPFSISAGVGFIALFGVAVLNGIVLIAEFNRLKSEGETDTKQIALQGTKNRLRPVLMTAFVASLGFLPMAISHGAGAEVQRPLATVVIGGLLVATFLTLFVLPVLYILFEKGFPLKRNKKTTITATTILLFGFLSFQNANAQQTIDLQSAIDMALKNNLLVKNENLQAEYQKKMKAAVVDIPQTNLTGEYGQINSIYKDTKFGISQSISFPTVYAKQRSLQNENYKNSVLNIAIKEAELKKQVSEVFYLLVYLQQKQKILLQNDSVYASFLEKANLRFHHGESNVLETATAETQRGQIAIQLNQLKNDVEITQLQFQLLLNTTSVFTPLAEKPKIDFTALLDTTAINNHPQIKVLQQQKQISLVNTQLEKSKLLPELNFGYNTQSIQGTGPDNVWYSKSDRFNFIQFGVGIPLFFFSQKAKISSAKTLELISENNYQIGLQTMQNELQSVFKQYQTHLQTVNYFENTALKNANTITKTANQQFANGDINYLEWTMLINNAISIQSNYIDAVKEFNQTIIQLNYLTSK